VTLFLDTAWAKEFAETDHAYYETVDGDHGRIEIRKYWITSDIDWLGAKASWAKLQSLGMVESRREHGEKVEIERRYYLVSLPADGVRFSEAVRQHWGVENQLHWGRVARSFPGAWRRRMPPRSCAVITGTFYRARPVQAAPAQVHQQKRTLERP